MTPIHPEFVPNASLSREEMEHLQHDIAERAVFADDFGFDPAAVGGESADAVQTQLGDSTSTEDDSTAHDEDGSAAHDEADSKSTGDDPPLVAGVDQAFSGDGERAISAIVVTRGGKVVERAYAVESADIPYIPGLLSFREGNAILSAFAELSVEPDLAVLDGSGRIHFRQAGIATHVGVTLDIPAIGVAKNLLCGRPREALDGHLPRGARVAIEADDSVTAPPGTVIGYAYQSRQYDDPETRHVNPLYVSPGHRVSAETTTDLVEQLCAGYKLPEPTRLADSYADEVKAEVEG
ncbi:endonuclease V [Halorussus litoreus]|uniref:endonuclease V n=1 Tax=Halorussus litoreus TaxID=1710536 RepID=UPI000E223681|nr:endonuclease V [Halorussus litoreus]